MKAGKSVTGAALVRAVLTLTLAVLVGTSLATHKAGDWFKMSQAAERGLTAVLDVRVENTCGIVGAATSHAVCAAVGRLPAWSAVAVIALCGLAPLWDTLRRRLLYWVAMTISLGSVFATALALQPLRSVPLQAGGRLGVSIAAAGVRFVGSTGTAAVLGLAALLIPFHAMGGFSRHIVLSIRRPRRRPRVAGALPHPSSPEEVVVQVLPEPLPVHNAAPAAAEIPAEASPVRVVKNPGPYSLPPQSLLRADGPMQSFVDPKEIERRRVKLEEALGSFGVTAKVVRAVPGPVITRFEVEPAPGIKVSRIESLADDISLALKALQTRVVAPIPGTGVVGVEVPNKRAAVVRIGDLMRAPVFQSSQSPLLLPIGRDAVGEPVACDLSTLPHLLIGGTTGSGKSSCINSFLCGLLMRVTPVDVRFILIDPKRVELTTYERIPHLFFPVVTDPKIALRALTWTAQEMERRYEYLSSHGLRDIGEFHGTQPGNGSMPYVVVVIDELADLMMSAPAEMEAVIIRIAQKARAVGIHLVVATQRPSKEIVTGVLKSNFPGRIAFQVMQRVNSTIILDSPGAERLLGKGDMLFLPPGAPGPQRVHGAFIT
ncbi:MAG: DNA translocase FtsK, partial [Candidatus Eisenbacteria bacterium]|nr:DNA translocase FtsK [Candidatus Eisenbacteria bacterium]